MPLSRQHGLWVMICVALLSHGRSAVLAESPVLLSNVTSDTGMTFRHRDGSSGQHYIVENVASGLALFDYDRDGDIDIYFLNGGGLKGTDYAAVPRNALYRNDGAWHFTDVTETSGLGDTGHGLGVAVGDYDHDGDHDVYITNFGPNCLYRNNGDGTFTDVTQAAGVADGSRVGAGANFLDVDQDGDLDLFASSYVQFTYENHVHRTIGGIPVYVGPRAYDPTPDTLYRNNGDGTFTDISDESGISAGRGTGMGTVCADYDNDGDTDIFVGNDLMQNFLWQNDGSGQFEEMGLLAGLGCDMNGNDMGTMGIGCGDFNNDGLLDFYATAYQDQLPSLYMNLGDGLFEDVSLLSGAGAGANHTVTWGNDFVDFDNDGDLDLFVALGHLQDNIAQWDQRSTYLAKNKVYLNDGHERFKDISETAGDGMQVELSSRGAAFDDLDNDGDIDVVVLNSRREPTLLRNDSPHPGHWLQVQLKGIKANRDGIGAHVIVTAKDLTRMDEVHSGRGYQSHYGARLHFGLGSRTRVDRIEVHWIGGSQDVFKDIAADQCILLEEGTGKQDALTKRLLSDE